MLKQTPISLKFPWRRGIPPQPKNAWRSHVLAEPPKPMGLRDPAVWTNDKRRMRSFDAPQWDMWMTRARSEDIDEPLQPFMDMPATLKARRYDVPWWANPFGAWYLQNVLALEMLKLPSRSNHEKIAIYRGRMLPAKDRTNPNLQDDETIIKRQIADRWRKLEFGPRAKGHPCTFADYIQFLNEWFKSLDEEGMQRLREHFDKKIRPLLAVMTHVDITWLEGRTQNSVDPELEKKVAAQTTLATPEFFDMSTRLKYEINEDYKVRDELGPELFALWSKAPERWPPERLAKMYSLDYGLVRKLLCWHHFKACYDSCVEPDWSLPKRLFAMEWIRDVRAREKGKFYGKLRYHEQKISFYNDDHLFKDQMNRREATYANVSEMDDPFRFIEDERGLEDYWGDNYDMYRRMFPEMTGRTGEPVQQYAPTPIWVGPHGEQAQRSRWNWMFAEIGVNVGHEALKKIELDPTNEKRRRFIIRQPDGTLRSAKMSEMRAWYWKEQWSDFRFWAPHMAWGMDDPQLPSHMQYDEHHADTADADIRKLRRIESRPTKWFYESHYTKTGEFNNVHATRWMQRCNDTLTHHPQIVGAGHKARRSFPLAKVFKIIQEDPNDRLVA